MSRLISITISALISDDADPEGVADAIINTAPMDVYSEMFDVDVQLLSYDVTLDVPVEEINIDSITRK